MGAVLAMRAGEAGLRVDFRVVMAFLMGLLDGCDHCGVFGKSHQAARTKSRGGQFPERGPVLGRSSSLPRLVACRCRAPYFFAAVAMTRS